jgi:hypothetical protein
MHKFKMWAIIQNRDLWIWWCNHLIKKYNLSEVHGAELWEKYNKGFDDSRKSLRLTPLEAINAELYELYKKVFYAEHDSF